MCTCTQTYQTESSDFFKSWRIRILASSAVVPAIRIVKDQGYARLLLQAVARH